jgi:hypothetical protein
MAKPQTKRKPKEIELEPDAWQRFERFIDGVAKSSVVPHPPAKPSATKKRLKGRTQK